MHIEKVKLNKIFSIALYKGYDIINKKGDFYDKGRSRK